MAIRFAPKDELKSASATVGKGRAKADPKAGAAASAPATGEADLFDAAPKTSARKRKKK